MKKGKHILVGLLLSFSLLVGAGAAYSSSKDATSVNASDDETFLRSLPTRGLTGDPILTDSVAQTYYKDISTTSTGDALKTELYNLIHPKKCSTAYGSIWNYLPYCDAFKPDDASNDQITAFYRGTGGSRGAMNKEHVWPNSRGGGSIEGDPHMVRPTFTADNSSRGNAFYNEGQNYDPNEFNAPQYRGICARIIFYCAVQEKSKLSLVDKTTDSTVSTSTGTMGKLSTLLKWNLDYPVDSTEILRNQVLSGERTVKGKSWNFNRNPFIDDRSYACRIWGNTNDATKEICKASTATKPTSISLNKTSASVQEGQTLQLSVSSVTPSDASTDVTWTSSNTSVATVSSTGLVTGKAKSSTPVTITATSALDTSVKATCSVTVTEPTPVNLTSISVSAGSTTLGLNKTTTVSVTTNPSYIYPAASISFTSSNTSIATVDNSSGLVTGKAVGEATITATATQGSIIKTASVKITVSESTETTYTKVTSALSDYSGDYLLVAESANKALDGSVALTKSNSGNQFAVTISNNSITGDYDAKKFTLEKNGSNYSLKSAEGHYYGASSSGNFDSSTSKRSQTVSISDSNMVLKDGSLTLRYNASHFRFYSNSSQGDPVSFYKATNGGSSTVTPSLSLNKSSATLEIDETTTITATASNGTGSVTWATSDSSVASLSATSGTSVTVTANKAGSATITATYSGISKTCAITVNGSSGGGEDTPTTSSGMKEAYEAAANLSTGGVTSDSYTFTGIVIGTVGYSFYVQDGSYGMYVYNKQVASIAAGKEITVQSTLQNYNGILETKYITSAALTNNEGYIEPVTVTSYDNLQTYNQSILANLTSGLVTEKVSAGVSGKSGQDWKIKVNLGGNDITVFANKYVSNMDNLNVIYDELKVGDYISIEKMVTSYYNGELQLTLTEQSTLSIGYTLNAFCEEFLNNMYCAASGMTPPTFATGYSWAKFKELYQALTSADQGELTNATANEDSELLKEQVAARYDYVVAKYTYENFMSRSISHFIGNRVSIFGENSNEILVILVTSFVALTSIGAFVIIRKRKVN